MSFLQDLQSKIKNPNCTVILPESDQERILLAAAQIVKKGIAIPVLVGKEDKIKELASQLKIDLNGIQFVDNQDEEIIQDVITKYHSINNLFSEKSLRRKVKNSLNFAAMCVAIEMYDCLAAGVYYSTGDVILSAQSLIGTQDNIQT